MYSQDLRGDDEHLLSLEYSLSDKRSPSCSPARPGARPRVRSPPAPQPVMLGALGLAAALAARGGRARGDVDRGGSRRAGRRRLALPGHRGTAGPSIPRRCGARWSCCTRPAPTRTSSWRRTTRPGGSAVTIRLVAAPLLTEVVVEGDAVALRRRDPRGRAPARPASRCGRSGSESAARDVAVASSAAAGTSRRASPRRRAGRRGARPPPSSRWRRARGCASRGATVECRGGQPWTRCSRSTSSPTPASPSTASARARPRSGCGRSSSSAGAGARR